MAAPIASASAVSTAAGRSSAFFFRPFAPASAGAAKAPTTTRSADEPDRSPLATSKVVGTAGSLARGRVSVGRGGGPDLRA